MDNDECEREQRALAIPEALWRRARDVEELQRSCELYVQGELSLQAALRIAYDAMVTAQRDCEKAIGAEYPTAPWPCSDQTVLRSVLAQADVLELVRHTLLVMRLQGAPGPIAIAKPPCPTCGQRMEPISLTEFRCLKCSPNEHGLGFLGC